MKLLAQDVTVKNGRTVPLDFYQGSGRRARVVLCYGYFRAVVPTLSPRLVGQCKELCQRFRAHPLGVRPFGPDYAYIRGRLIKIGVGKGATVSPDSLVFSTERDYNRFLTAEARRYFGERLLFWRERMGIEASYRLRVTNAYGRLGSNSLKSMTISLASPLLAFSPEIADAVVVHELAHHFVRDHSPRFHALVESYLPDVAKRDRLIREGNFTGAML